MLPLPLAALVPPTMSYLYGYELIEAGEVTTENPGDVTTVQFDAGESTDEITVSTAGSND